MIEVQIIDRQRKIKQWPAMMLQVPFIGHSICYQYWNLPVTEVEWIENQDHTWRAFIYVDTSVMD